MANFVHDYLKKIGGISMADDGLVVLSAGNISNAYFNCRGLNDKDGDKYTHANLLTRVGDEILDGFNAFGNATAIIGIKTTGATLAKFAGDSDLSVNVYYINPHDEKNGDELQFYSDVDCTTPIPAEDLTGETVVLVDDVKTSGKAFKYGAKLCKKHLISVVGAIVLVDRTPGEPVDGLADVSFVSLYEVGSDFVFISEPPVHGEGLLAPNEDGTPVTIRLDLGHASEKDWPTLYPQYNYVGEPNFKG